MLCTFRRRYLRRYLTWLLTVSLSCIGIRLLVAYDSNLMYKRKHVNTNHSAYHRRTNIRGDWHQVKKEGLLQKVNMQLDEVVRDDEIHKHEIKDLVRNISYKVMGPLEFIPSVPDSSDSDIVPSLFKRVTEPFLSLPNITYSQKIVILTPICDLEGALDRYTRLLSQLSYPHSLISVYFGEDSSKDRTFDLATLIATDLKEKYGFRDAAAFHFDISGGVHGSWGNVHYRNSQLKRRSHLAKARNMLLNVGMRGGEFDYVLWIDGDISELPEDIVQQLIFAKSDVVAAACLYKNGGYRHVFDKNSWRETPTSLQKQRGLSKDVLLVEGYTVTYRIFLSHLKAEGRTVRLDGVGGCALLIKTDCHRSGLKFPEIVYKNHIETEGLAKMAKDMGYSVVGMPFVEVVH